LGKGFGAAYTDPEFRFLIDEEEGVVANERLMAAVIARENHVLDAIRSDPEARTGEHRVIASAPRRCGGDAERFVGSDDERRLFRTLE